MPSAAVATQAKNATGAMWSGVVTESKTGKSTPVGTLFYPHLPNRTGFGDLKIQSDDFLEYFAGGDCDGAPAPLLCNAWGIIRRCVLEVGCRYAGTACVG